MGQHQGLVFYTIGQRKRINIAGGPWFVKGFQKNKNILVVTKNKKEVEKKDLYLSPYNFISPLSLKKPIKVKAKVRAGQAASPAVLSQGQNNRLKLTFTKPQFAVTPGQFAVFYQKSVCLGGGKINE